MGLPNNHGLPVVFKRQHGAKNLITDVKEVFESAIPRLMTGIYIQV